MRTRAETLIRPFEPKDAAPVRRVVEDVFREFGLWRDHSCGMADLDDIPRSFSFPKGCFFVVDSRGRIEGCGGLKPARDGKAELSRMYFRRAARGRGLGKEMLARILAHAEKRRFGRIFLETSTRLERAIRFYARAGFKGRIVDTDNCCNVYMERRAGPRLRPG